MLTSVHIYTSITTSRVLLPHCYLFIFRNCAKQLTSFHLLRLLLLYHEPELCSFLDTKKIIPEAYAKDWVLIFHCLEIHLIFLSVFHLRILCKFTLVLWNAYILTLLPYYSTSRNDISNFFGVLDIFYKISVFCVLKSRSTCDSMKTYLSLMFNLSIKCCASRNILYLRTEQLLSFFL